MSQVQLLATAPVSLPPITYKGQPVVTTEMLASAYGCPPKNIYDNFRNNRDRFVEGKHFFLLTNGELKDFCDYSENFGIVIPARTRHFTIWTERGSLYHAKSIGTDHAWSVYDVLVETFFRAIMPEPQQPAPALEAPDSSRPRRPHHARAAAQSAQFFIGPLAYF